ncbi:hypothetical protein AAG906_029365 [Vitis piasezkii]
MMKDLTSSQSFSSNDGLTLLVTLEKPIGKFMESHRIGKVTEHMKMNLKVIVPPIINYHSPIPQPTKHH